MTDWLRGHGVTAAALEGTGVYWQAPFEALEDAGILAGLTCHVQAKLEPLARVLAATLDPLVLLTLQVEAVDRADAAIVALDTRIRDALADYQRPLRLLQTIPGIDRGSACTILVEIGPDLAAFRKARHLGAWAGVAPGNNASAGKRRAGRAGLFDLSTATDLLTDAQSALGLTIRDDAVANMENMARVSVSNSLSGRHWELNQVPAVGDPTDIVQFGMGHHVSANEGRRRVALQRRVAAYLSCSRPGSRQVSVQDHGHSRTAHGREILAASFRSGAPRMGGTWAHEARS